ASGPRGFEAAAKPAGAAHPVSQMVSVSEPRGDGDEVGYGGSVFGPPGEHHAAGLEVVDRYEDDSRSAVVTGGGHRSHADSASACDQVAVGFESGSLSDHGSRG